MCRPLTRPRDQSVFDIPWLAKGTHLGCTPSNIDDLPNLPIPAIMGQLTFHKIPSSDPEDAKVLLRTLVTALLHGRVRAHVVVAVVQVLLLLVMVANLVKDSSQEVENSGILSQ